MRTQPFAVFQPVPGQPAAKPLFVIHAYSIEQAREIAAAMVAGKIMVIGPITGAAQ